MKKRDHRTVRSSEIVCQNRPNPMFVRTVRPNRPEPTRRSITRSFYELYTYKTSDLPFNSLLADGANGSGTVSFFKLDQSNHDLAIMRSTFRCILLAAVFAKGMKVSPARMGPMQSQRPLGSFLVSLLLRYKSPALYSMDFIVCTVSQVKN